VALTLREIRMLRPQYVAMSGGLAVGRICKTSDHLAGDWSWSIFGINAGLGVMEIKGSLETFDEAKARVDANWEKWLVWAKLSELS
jgi:hypothetical protein